MMSSDPLPMPAVPPQTVSVMTLGDSITDGFGARSYRAELDDELHADGVTASFVGSQFDGTYHHEGHPGYSIADIAAQVDGWIAAAHPQLIDLMIGTNDVDSYGTGHPDGAADRLQSLVDQILKDAPAASLIIATIPPNTAGGPVDALNTAIAGIVSGEQAAGNHVYLADIHAAVSVSDLRDGVHPDDAGQIKIGDAFLAADLDALAAAAGGAQAPLERALYFAESPGAAALHADPQPTLASELLSSGGSGGLAPDADEYSLPTGSAELDLAGINPLHHYIEYGIAEHCYL